VELIQRFRQYLERVPVVVETAAVVLMAFVVFRPFASLGVDPHHDGIVFTTARGISNGLTVNKDVFTQYGPISAWVQGLALRMFGDNLLTLRMTAMVALALAAGLFYASWRTLWGRWVALTGVLLWVGCAYFFSPDMPAIPWTSDIVLLIQGAATLLVTLSMRSSKVDATRLLVGAGFLIGLLPFTRLNTGILTVIALVGFSVLFQTRRDVLSLCIGLFTSLASVLFVLMLTGALTQWWYQGVIFPRSLYHGQLGSIGLVGLRANALVNGLTGIGYLAFTVFLLRQFRADAFEHSSPLSRYRRFFAVWAMRLGVALAWIWLVWLADPRGFLSPLTLQWGVLLATPFLVVRRLLALNSSNSSDFNRVLIFGLVVGSLGQLYPTIDLRHVWWASLPAFGLAMSEIREYVSGRPRLILVSLSLLLPIALISIDRIDVTRKKYETTIQYASTLEGMRVNETFVKAFQSRFTAIKDFERAHGPRPVLNVCQDGLFASVGGRFALPDPYFVYWPFSKFDGNFEARRNFISKKKPFIWMCDPLSDPTTYAAQFGYRLVATPACTKQDPQLNVWPWKSLLAVPSDWAELPIEKKWNRQTCSKLPSS